METMQSLRNKAAAFKKELIRLFPPLDDLFRYLPFRRFRFGRRCPYCRSAGCRTRMRLHFTALRECPSCRLIFVYPRPGVKHLEEYYSRQYRVAGAEPEELKDIDLSNLRETVFNRSRELCFVTEHKKGGELLDLGCSWGFLMLQAREMGFAVRGVEVGAPYAEYARERLGLDVFAGQLEDARFPDGTFDAVIGVHVLEHLPSLKRSLQEIRRILKPDGISIFIVPNFDSAAREILGPAWAWLDVHSHYYHLTKPFFEKALAPLGFDLSFRSEEGHYGMDFLKSRFSEPEIRDIHRNLKGSELIVIAKKLGGRTPSPREATALPKHRPAKKRAIPIEH